MHSKAWFYTFDPFHIRQETWANSTSFLFLLSVHIKASSSKNTLRMLIFHNSCNGYCAEKERRRSERWKGDLLLVIYSGQSLTLIHIHSSSVPHVCPALKKTNNRYPSLSSRSPLSTHYPSSTHSLSFSYPCVSVYLYIFMYCRRKNSWIFLQKYPHKKDFIPKKHWRKKHPGSLSVCVRGIFS